MDTSWLDNFERKFDDPALRKSTTKILSTSYREIDEALGINGLPLGKVIDIAGEPAVGKTNFALDLVAFAQQNDLSCVWLDIDRTFDSEYAVRKMVNVKDLLVFQPPTIEGIVPGLIQLMKEGLADIIIFDSISNLPLLSEDNNIPLKTMINPLLQKLIEYKTTLIFLSQIRKDLINGGNTTPRNLALDDLCNIRIMFNFLSVIKHQEVVIGHKLEVDIYKNDMAPLAKTEIELFV